MPRSLPSLIPRSLPGVTQPGWSPWLRLLALLFVCFSAIGAQAEKVADLPMPTSYVNDFAQVLSPAGRRQIEDYCLSVHQQANAEVVVATIKSLDDGDTVEQFTVALEEKWKLGKKGEDPQRAGAAGDEPA